MYSIQLGTDSKFFLLFSEARKAGIFNEKIYVFYVKKIFATATGATGIRTNINTAKLTCRKIAKYFRDFPLFFPI